MSAIRERIERDVDVLIEVLSEHLDVSLQQALEGHFQVPNQHVTDNTLNASRSWAENNILDLREDFGSLLRDSGLRDELVELRLSRHRVAQAGA